MLFLFSLMLAAAFSVFCGKALRKHPAPFYLTAAVVSIGTTVLANMRIPEIPTFVQQNIIALFTKGILAAAFWAVVMWTGALSNGSPMMKKLMPQRGQLSIFSAILTLGHAVGLGIAMLPRWFSKSDAVNICICGVFMLIMLPLTVLSVQKIRRKMKAKTWKSIQRSAYIFYALIPVHIIVLNIAKARSGRKDVLFDLMVYLVVFLGYAVCRINKWYRMKKKPERLTALKIASWGVFLVGMAVFAAAAFPQKQSDTVRTNIADAHEITAQTEASTTAAASAVSSQKSETVTSSDSYTTKSTTTTATTEMTETNTITAATETTESDSAESTTETTEAETTTEIEVTTVQSENEKPAEQTEPVETESVPEETEPPAPVRIYQDGTFTASAFGYDGNITVHVTIQDDCITEITAETEEADDSYFIDAKKAVIPAIIRSQAADVDAFSGATYSSNAIMKAVQAALESARI